MSARHDYLTYVHFCCAIGVMPWTPQQWAMMTQQSVDVHWEKWAEYITKSRHLAIKTKLTHAAVDIDHDGAWAKRKRPRRSDDAQRAGVLGLFIGELRPDGSVVPVRHQELAREKRTLLTARVCRACLQFLPASQFSRHGNKTTRTTCKKCDNARRVQARRDAR